MEYVFCGKLVVTKWQHCKLLLLPMFPLGKIMGKVGGGLSKVVQW